MKQRSCDGRGRAAPWFEWQCAQKDGCAQRTGAHARPKPTSRLNMELDLQSLFGLLCTAVLIGWDPLLEILHYFVVFSPSEFHTKVTNNVFTALKSKSKQRRWCGLITKQLSYLLFEWSKTVSQSKKAVIIAHCKSPRPKRSAIYLIN